jgi:Flp pilus assembly protein TadG
MWAHPKKFCGDDRGASAVEFAIAGPLFILLLVGLFFMSLCLAVIGSAHFAVEESARCAAVRTTVCSDDSTTIAYAKSHYFGPSSLPEFTYDSAAPCGHSVRASIDYVVDLGLKQITVPIRAEACFP